jgi:hypothetical protein
MMSRPLALALACPISSRSKILRPLSASSLAPVDPEAASEVLRDVTITTCHQLRRGTWRQVACLSEVSWPTSMNTFPRTSVNNALRLLRRAYAAPSSYCSTPLTLRTLTASSCIVATAWLRRTYLGLMTERSLPSPLCLRTSAVNTHRCPRLPCKQSYSAVVPFTGGRLSRTEAGIRWI